LSARSHARRQGGRRAPRWLKLVNPINRFLLSRGIGPAPQHLLRIAGRRTGRPRTTPVAVVTVDGDRYVVAGFDGSDWVANARVAGTGQLRRGRDAEDVALTEVPIAQRGPILRAFAANVRGGQPFVGVAPHAPADAFAEAGARHPVFRLDPASSSA
jgi:deazaflavin-dependent oxidoreductase (nitroreductase family)